MVQQLSILQEPHSVALFVIWFCTGWKQNPTQIVSLSIDIFSTGMTSLCISLFLFLLELCFKRSFISLFFKRFSRKPFFFSYQDTVSKAHVVYPSEIEILAIIKIRLLTCQIIYFTRVHYSYLIYIPLFRFVCVHKAMMMQLII